MIRVIISDDHGIFRVGLRALLEKPGGIEIVAEAGDGTSTLDVVRTVSFDVLLLDISMPGLSTREIIPIVRREYPAAAVVVLTMHEDENFVSEFLSLGAQGYVLKQSTPTELVHAIHSVVSGQRYLDPNLTSSPILLPVARNSAGRADNRERLSIREIGICGLLAQGFSNGEIAEKLAISERTVETHRSHIMRKLGIKTRAELFQFASNMGYVKA